MGEEITAAQRTMTPEFESVLRYLRTLADSCAPPMGAGGFDVLYASAREVVVWFSPARDGQSAREVAIPAEALSAAWQFLWAGHVVDEAVLASLGLGPAGIQWVIALLAQIPGIEVRLEPLTLAWTPLPEVSDAHAPGHTEGSDS